MRNTSLALTLSCLLLAGVAFAQQTPSGTSSSTSATQAPAKIPAPSTAPANALTDAQARQMFEVTGAIEMKDQLVHGMMNYLHSSMPFLPKDVSDDLEQSFQKLDLETPIIAIYKQHISTEDADSIIAFYKTPAGKHLIKAMPEILQQSQQAGVQMFRKAAQDGIERHRPEVEAAAKQYQQDHAPKPAPSLSTPSPTPNAAPAAKPSTTSPNSATPQPH